LALETRYSSLFGRSTPTLRCFAALALLLCCSAAPADPQHDAPALSIGVSAGGAPMAFFDQGVLRGLEVDLARALARAMGAELRLQEMPQARLIDALRGGRIDLLLSTLPEPDLAALGLVAGEALLDIGQMAMIRAEDAARFARPVDIITTTDRVGYQHGSAGARFVQANLPAAERVPVPDATWGIAALRAGDIDVFIHDATTVWAVAANADEQELIGLFHPFTDERLRWIMRAEDELLRRNLGFIVRNWRESGKLRSMINRWISVQVEVGS
jgi:ABC-type amino acid transport substrate-binding protein